MPLSKHAINHMTNHTALPASRLPLQDAPPLTSPSWQIETHPAEAVIYRPTEEVHHLYLVRQGRVRLLRATSGGGRALVALLGPGEVFGEQDAAAGPIGEYAVAGSDVEVWTVTARQLTRFCEEHPEAAIELISGMSARLRNLRGRVVGFTGKEVPARLSDAILTLGETHGDTCTHGGEIDLRHITQQDLADLVGASRSFVSTLINEMKRQGSLGSVGRVLCLRDVKALRKASETEG